MVGVKFMKKDKLMSVRVDEDQLERLSRSLGVDQSKVIRASMNLTENVLLNFFGGEVGNIFKRKKTNEEEDKYQKL